MVVLGGWVFLMSEAALYLWASAKSLFRRAISVRSFLFMFSESLSPSLSRVLAPEMIWMSLLTNLLGFAVQSLGFRVEEAANPDGPDPNDVLGDPGPKHLALSALLAWCRDSGSGFRPEPRLL